jgi:hypothetical protein
MSDGEFATPPDHDADLDERSRLVGADEHDHLVGLTDVTNRVPQRMEHVRFDDAVAMRRLQDDGLV